MLRIYVGLIFKNTNKNNGIALNLRLITGTAIIDNEHAHLHSGEKMGYKKIGLKTVSYKQFLKADRERYRACSLISCYKH
jgi:hypothetical protein